LETNRPSNDGDNRAKWHVNGKLDPHTRYLDPFHQRANETKGKGNTGSVNPFSGSPSSKNPSQASKRR